MITPLVVFILDFTRAGFDKSDQVKSSPRKVTKDLEFTQKSISFDQSQFFGIMAETSPSPTLLRTPKSARSSFRRTRRLFPHLVDDVEDSPKGMIISHLLSLLPENINVPILMYIPLKFNHLLFLNLMGVIIGDYSKMFELK